MPTTNDKEITRKPHPPGGLRLLDDTEHRLPRRRLEPDSVALATNVTVFMEGSTK